MLFEHAKDPEEMKNLARDTVYAKTVAEMQELPKELQTGRRNN
jgi:hypothetical protein